MPFGTGRMPRSSSNDDWRRYRVACLSDLIWLFTLNDGYDGKIIPFTSELILSIDFLLAENQSRLPVRATFNPALRIDDQSLP